MSDIESNLSSDVSAENLALRTHEEVHEFQNVQEELVAAVFDPFSSPAYLARYLRSDLGLFFFGRGLYALLGDECLQDTGIAILRVSEIENFCKFCGNFSEKVGKN